MFVKEVMTDISEVVMLPLNTVFDQEKIDFIFNIGHSRIPIFEDNEQNIIGVIHVK